MIFKFIDFNFTAFKDFLKELHDMHGFSDINFYPDKEELFTKEQLIHVGKNWDLSSPDSFMGAWMKLKDEVKKVSFHYYSKDKKKQIRISVNLNKKIISLDKIESMSAADLINILQSKMEIKNKKENSKFKNIKNIFIRYTKEIIIGLFITVLGGIILYFLLPIR